MKTFYLLSALLLLQAPTYRLPTVTADNLEGKTLTFPRDLEGTRNVLFIPFVREQQAVVDSWVPFVKTTLAAHPGNSYYELPTIKKMIGLMKWTINKGMAGGIPDKGAREHTMTLYLDKEPFKKALGITDEKVVTVLVVDKSGTVLWRETGAFTPAKGAALAAAIAAP